MKELVELEEEVLKYRNQNLPDDLLTMAKKDGFSDRYLSKLMNIEEKIETIFLLSSSYQDINKPLSERNALF